MKKNFFGENLKQNRIKKQLSQKELAKVLNVSNQTVSYWEIGKREPCLNDLIQIAEYFDISLDDLLLE